MDFSASPARFLPFFFFFFENKVSCTHYWGAGAAISRGSIPGPKFPDFPPNKLHGKCCLSNIRFKDQFESWAGTRIWIQRIPIFPITAFSGGGKIPCFLARGLGQKKVKLLMQAPPTDPLMMPAIRMKAQSTLRPTTEDVKRKPNDWPVP